LKWKVTQSKHHIKPQSRGGREIDNIVVLPHSFHKAWHLLFDTLTVEEAHLLIDMIMRPNRTWTISLIKKLRKKIEKKDVNKQYERG